MKNIFRRITSSITALAMTLSMCNGIQLTSFAEEVADNVVGTGEGQISVTDYGLSDDELLLGYFENKLYGIDGGISLFTSRGPGALSGSDLAVYNEIKTAAVKIASGQQASTEVAVSTASWTYDQLGFSSSPSSSDIQSAINGRLGVIYDYLLCDLPYDMYWHDKSIGVSYSYSYSSNPTSKTISASNVKIKLSPGVEYAATSSFTVDTAKTSAASAAASNAQAIVTANAGKSDLERLTAYKNAICDLVSYDYVALENINTQNYYVDPWQVIHVFDDDESTKVVCEGYSKAFQYLCDLDGVLTCYSVSGSMSGGTGAGGHMWNIVTLNGANYLVDVTNCDEGSAGYPDELFLKGMTELTAAESYYRTIQGINIYFTYYDEMATIFGTDILTLSEDDYVDVPVVTGLTYTGTLAKTSYYLGDTFDATGLSFALAYSDGSEVDVEVADITFSELAYGDTAVTATYGEYSVEITGITVDLDSVTGVAIKNNPTKLVYATNDCFDPSGLVVTVSYKSGKTTDVEYSSENADRFTFKPELDEFLHADNTEIVVTHRNVENTIPVTVAKGNVTATYAGDTEIDYLSSRSIACTVNDGENDTINGTSVFRLVNENGEVVFEGNGIGAGGALIDQSFEGQMTSNLVVFSKENGINAGTYKLMFKYLGGTLYEAYDDFVLLSEITVKKLVPDLPNVRVLSPEKITTNNSISDIILTSTTYLDGELTLDDNQTITAGTNTYNWTFVPTDSTNYETVTGTIQITADIAALDISFPEGAVLTYGLAGQSIKVALADGENYVYDGTSSIAIFGDSAFGYLIGTSAPFMETINGILYKGHVITASGALNSSTPYFHAGTINAEFVYDGTEDYAEKTYPFTITVNKLADYEEYLDIEVTGNVYTGTTVAAAEQLMSAEITIGGNTYEGTVEFADSVTGFTTSQTEYAVIFTPDDTDNIESLETTVTINVMEDAVADIAVSDNSTAETAYTYGDAFDPTGLVIDVTYISGTTKEIAYTEGNKADFGFSPAKLAVADNAVTVTYGGKTADIAVTVAKATPDIGDVTVTPNTIYDSMTTDNLTFKILNTKVDGKITIDDGQTLVGGQFNNISWTFTPDDTDNYIVLTGKEEIMVNTDTIKSISVKTNPTKTAYKVGDTFDAAGLVITAAYNNGPLTKDFAYADNAAAFSFDKTTLAYGDEAVTVTYGGKTASIDINVGKIELEAEYWSHTEFTYGDEEYFYVSLKDGDTAVEDGTSVFNLYKSGETANPVFTVAGEGHPVGQASVNKAYFEHNDIHNIDAGTYDLYFNYTGTDAYASKDYGKIAEITVDTIGEYEVTVTVVSPTDIYTSTAVDDVILGASANVSGTTYAGTAAFADSVTEFTTAKTEYEVIFTPESSNLDPINTKVSITVSEDTLENIAVTTAPAKSVYVEGDKLDTNGLVVTATYASGATKVIDASLLTVVPETFSKGDTSVTVSYGGKTATISGLTVKGKLAADKFEFTAPAGLTYDGTTKTATVTAADGVTGIGEITVRYFEGQTELASAPVNAGTYSVVIDVAAGDEYVAATNISDNSWTFTIAKADLVIAPRLRAPSVVYDTTSVSELSLTSGTDIGGVIAFDGEITLEVGEKAYPVIFTPMDSKNYNTVTGTVTINVLRNVITGISVKTAPNTAYTYGEEFDPEGLVITATYLSGKTEDVAYNTDNASDFSFTPDELTVATTAVTVTYAEKTTDINITVAQATPDYTVPTSLTATYGDTLADVTLTTGWSWLDGTVSVGNVGANSFPATYDNGDANYKTVTENVSVTVSPKSISIDSAAVNDKEYDGTTTAVVKSVTFAGIEGSDSIDYTATGVFADKNAGEDKNVTVTVTINETNYVLDSNTITATAAISKADPEVTVPATASVIEGKPLSWATLPEGWAWDNATITPVDGQSYGATYTPDDTTNYNTLTTTITVSVFVCTHADTTETVVDATCTTDGSKTVFCNICEETVSTEIIPAAHSWETDYTIDTEATCTTDGQKSIHCSKCTEIKPDSEVVIPAAHSWETDYTIDTEATCTTDGQKSIHCSKCTEIKPDSEVVIPAAHSWNSSYTIDTEATCTTDGQKSIHCSKCTEIKPDSEVVIPAGHDWSKNYSADAAYHWIKCGKCDEIKDKGEHTPGYVVNSHQLCAVCLHSYDAADDKPVKGYGEGPGAGYTYPIHTQTKSDAPQIKGENGKFGWKVISDELSLAEDGDTVIVDMNGTTKLPKAILEDIEGRNIDLVLDMGSGITWTINGETVTNPKAVDFRVTKNVKRIPVDVIDNVTGDNFTMEISLAHNGDFGFEAMLTISLGRKYNDLYANLYYYNPSDKGMEFIDSDLIANGNAQLIFNHASDYAIVIDEEALGDDVSSASGVTADSKTMDTETVSVVFALPLVLAAGLVIRKKLCK